MGVADEIRGRLETAFSPREIEVHDDSAAHAGHANAPPGGESHFAVRIRAEPLKNLSRIERHRAVHTALGTDLVSRIHALQIDAAG